MAENPTKRRRHIGARTGNSGSPLLTEVAFAFAFELVEQLKREDRPDLAASVADLRVVEVCRCSDPDCSSVYVTPSRRLRWRGLKRRETIGLLTTRGTVNVDVLESKIALIEVLDRPDVAEALAARFRPS
jgi:hypothetical protein